MRSQLLEISNDRLTERLNAAVREERRLTIEVLRLLLEVERRELFARMGYSSLFNFCIDYLKYSEAAAQRRIVSMRALRDMPELEEKIETGKLSLSVLAMTESTLKQNAKLENRKVGTEERRIALDMVEGLSRRKAEFALVEKLGLEPIRIESTERPLRNGGVRIVLELTKEEIKEIDDLRRLSSRPQTAKEMILNLVRSAAAKRRRKLGEAPLLRNRVVRTDIKSTPSSVNGSSIGQTTSAGGSELAHTENYAQKSRNGQFRFGGNKDLPHATKRIVWLRADARCEHLTAYGGRCFARHSLEFDHVVPRAHGGQDEPDNLRLLCCAHHRLLTTDIFGPRKMRKFRPSLQL
jgi:hypothetical protein